MVRESKVLNSELKMELGMTQIPLFSLWALKVELVANKDEISDAAKPGTPCRFDRLSFLSLNSLLS
jgi:hypothetical protein